LVAVLKTESRADAAICRGGPRFLSSRVTATTRLDQQLSHAPNYFVIFDLLR
jgi:hypothetical protein